MNIIDERDVRTVYRKLRKKEFDDIITLSARKDETVRLLDEGMVVTAGGNPDFYIMKGTLQAFYDALPDNYEGSINLGHMTFASFPILLGNWRKKDLKVVDIGGGRKGLDVTLRLDDKSLLVKELRRAKYSLGVSAEFSYKYDEEATDSYGILMVNEIFIHDFAIVGEAGNVNSSGIELKGEKMEFSNLIKLMGEEKDLSAINDLIDQALEEKKLDATEEKTADPEEKPSEEGKKLAETPKEEEKLAEEGDKNLEAEEKPAEEISLASVMEAINGLNAKIDALSAENEDLKQKLSAKEQEEAKFVQNFKKLNTALATERKETVVTTPVFTDGIGG